MSLLIEDSDFILELNEQEDDKDRVRIMVSEMFCKAVAIQHMAEEQGITLTFMEAYTSCSMQLLRSAFEEPDGAAMAFYSSLEDTCPKCANMLMGLLGLIMERDILEHLAMVVGYTSEMDVDMESEALAFVARHAARVLLGIKMTEIDIECLESCTDNNRTIESMRNGNN